MSMEASGEQIPEDILKVRKEEIEKDLKEITDAFLENAGEEELKKREEYQKKLNEFLEEASDDEKKLVNAIKIRNSLLHKNWIEARFSRNENNLEMPKKHIRSKELDTQPEKMHILRDKLSEEKFKKIENLVSDAYPEYYKMEYKWEK